jgi:hypothetical protein
MPISQKRSYRPVSLRKEGSGLLACIRELLSNESEIPGIDDLVSLKRRSLDWINLRGLADNHIYREIETLEPAVLNVKARLDWKEVEEGRRREFLKDLRSRLELAMRLKFGSRQSPPHKPRMRRYISKSESERRTLLVLSFVEQLNILKAEISSQKQYDAAKQCHSTFRVFDAAENYVRQHPGVTNPIFGIHEYRTVRPLAQQLAACWYGLSDEAIRKDTNKHFRRLSAVVAKEPETRIP